MSASRIANRVEVFARGQTAPGNGPAAFGFGRPVPARRLTSREYLNTTRDLLGDTTLRWTMYLESRTISATTPPFRQPTAIGTLDAANLQSAAEALAKKCRGKLSALLPCTPANAAGEACAACSSRLGAKAYRRPLTAAETATLNGLYQTARKR